MILSIILLNLTCSVLCYGMTLGYFAGKFPTLDLDDHKSFSVDFSIPALLFGPISLITIYFLSGRCKYGLRFK